MLRVWTAIAAASILVLALARIASLEPHRENGLLPIGPPTPYYRLIPEGDSLGRVLVVHGLGASKEFMQVFASAIADAGFEVFAIDLPGHGSSLAGFTASGARDVVVQTLDQIGDVNIVVGHSLGAGLVLDIAHERNFEKMVLISPAPTPVDAADLSRTLVVTGAWDIPAINAFVPRLEGAEWWRLPWAAHSSAIYNASQTRDIIRWMGGRVERLRTIARLWWSALMIVSSMVLGISLFPPQPVENLERALRIPDVAARFVLAGTASAITSHFVVLFRFLHLFATDYLISVFFLIGVFLVSGGRVVLFKHTFSARSVFVAIGAAAYVIIVVGMLAGGHFLHFTLTDGRWWRFPIITVAGFPLFFFDETIRLRGPSGWKSPITGVLTRGLIGASILTGVLILNRQAAFLVLIIHLMVLFWIALWFATEVVRRHTRSPFAAAIFASLVQGWIFAAWFVTV